MKSLKILGLTAVVAGALITLLGAGTASATVLCKEAGTGSPTGTTCPSGKGYGAEQEIHAVNSGNVKLDTTFKTISCTGSTIKGTTSKEGSATETVTGPEGTLTLTGCNCSTVKVLHAGTLEIHWISGTHNGTVTSSGSETTTICSTIFGNVHCTYATSNTDVGTLAGGTTATLTASSHLPVNEAESDGLCPEESTWTATYSVTTPDALYVTSATGSGATATTLTTSLSGEGKSGEEITILEGSKAKDTATLSGTNAGKATGKVTYKVYADKECKELVTSAGEVTVSEGKVPASEEKELEAGRVYYWQAEYSGDSNNLKSTSTCGKEVLTVKAKTTLTTSLSGEGKSGEEITILEGSKAKDTATLSGTKSSTATGKVKYKVYADKECKELVTEAGEVTVSEGKVPDSEEKTLEAGRVYYWQASYEGDSLHEKSTSACGKEVLTIKASTSLGTSLSGEAKSGEEITILEGSKAKDTATLSGTKSSTATGKVKFRVYKDKECKELASEAGEGSLSEGKATSEEKTLEAGTVYYWQAEYPGDSLHQASTSTCGKEVLTVKANTSLATLLYGEGQEGEEITIAEGSIVADSAILSGTNVSTATGTIAYSLYADPACEELVAEAGEVSVAEAMGPISEEEELEEGTFYWRASYSGDSLHGASTSSCGSEIVRVLGATSLATTLSGEGEEGGELGVVEGAAIHDSATLSGKHASEATGTVKYSVYADPACEELVAEAGEVAVSGASFPPSEGEILEPGTYYWQAEYSGDSFNHASVSECGAEIAAVVEPITTELSSGETFGENLGTLEGTAISDEATLHGEHASEATGTVKYSLYADPACEELVAEAGEVAVSGEAVPPSSAQMLSQGTFYWQAEYSGDATNPPAVSKCGSEIAIVTTSTSLTTVLSGGEEENEEIEVEAGTAVKDQAVLGGANAATAIGSVQYFVYGDSECTELVSVAGGGEVSEGIFPPSDEETLSPGTYYWQAEYSGDGVNQGALSECGSEVLVVAPPPITTNLSGGSQSGAEVQVPEGTPLTDEATLHGEHASEATGTVKYSVYADPACEELVAEAGEVGVSGASVPASSEEELEEGSYYWRAIYSGDTKNSAATSECGSEVAIVVPPEADQYAALGDSYSAGQGISEGVNAPPGFYAQTARWFNPHQNTCHRSEAAWPALVAKAKYGAGVVAPGEVLKQQPAHFIFRACNGARMEHIFPLKKEAGGQFDEVYALGPPNDRWFTVPVQGLWLSIPGGVFEMPTIPNPDIRLVTLTIGGNNVGFASIARACIEGFNDYSLANCQKTVGEQEKKLKLIKEKLPEVLDEINHLALWAQIRVPLYPKLLKLKQGTDIVVATTGKGKEETKYKFNNTIAGTLGWTAAELIDQFTNKLDETIQRAIGKAAAEGVPAKAIPQAMLAFKGHQLGDAQPWLNKLILNPFRVEESFHPNQCGQKAIARLVLNEQKVPMMQWPASC